jgi:very-short-patch-repair endonuclease
MNRRVIERNMFYGAKKRTFLRAIELRKNMTDSEKILWNELKNRENFKARWKSQHPVDIYIVDFYCHKHKLVIEVDGEIHLQEDILERDDGRAYEIERFGLKILRFTNKEINDNLESVKAKILKEIESSSPLQGI